MGCNEIFSLMSDDIGYVFIFPKGGFSSGHPTDAGNAVDNCIVVSLAGL